MVSDVYGRFLLRHNYCDSPHDYALRSVPAQPRVLSSSQAVLGARFEVIAVFLDGICILIRTEGEVEAEARTRTQDMFLRIYTRGGLWPQGHQGIEAFVDV